MAYNIASSFKDICKFNVLTVCCKGEDKEMSAAWELRKIIAAIGVHAIRKELEHGWDNFDELLRH